MSKHRIPRLFMEYGFPFDFDPAGEVSPQMVAWCQQMPGDFDTLWREQGNSLLEVVVERFQRGFKRTELSVYLIAHKSVLAMSHPLLINIRRRIPEDFSQQIQTPKSFIGTVFHEMMHRYIMDQIDLYAMNQSPLLLKYSDESDTVKYHIHLMAMLSLGFRGCGREDDLKKMIAVEKQIPDPGYARARQIEQIEGTEEVLRDFASHALEK